ncbi:hypothetical protein [Streptomyces atriruber]|uniref:hypothetical protein n=1 Tax=Streptomyces atriruber TaxID=545121 RepID=UPI0007C87CB9|nr:hypothetical protein [Streptomyces atriruber]
MPTVTPGCAVAAICLAALLVSPLNARADFSSPAPETHEASARTGGQSIASKVAFTIRGAAGTKSPGTLTPTTTWTPPPCWYEPYWKARDFKKFMQAKWLMHSAAGGDGAELASDQARLNGGHPYKDFNVAKNDDGMWWTAIDNTTLAGDATATECTRDPFWVDKGDVPDVPRAISPEMLAGLAYQETQVPGTDVSMAPGGGTKVGLPTWIWLDRAEPKAVSATARLPEAGLWATATAEPVSLRVDPGTSEAETYPASGECVIEGGSIGEPYARGKARETPPCGVRYLRASGDASYELGATLTWRMSWKGSGGTSGDLPDGAFGTGRAIAVQEIQAVNR